MGQYFSNEDLKSNIKKYNVEILGAKFSFYTDNGVFSKSKLDFGTRVLLEALPLSELKGDILDVGCGYGVISIVLSKLTNLKILGIDVNRRALHLSCMNKEENHVDKVSFQESNGYDNITKKYDCIITNPPIRAGKEVVYKILFGAKDYLKENGKLFLVVNRDQGAKSLLRDLDKVYKTTILEKKKGFFVIKCEFD